jgi:hypothetical protein
MIAEKPFLIFSNVGHAKEKLVMPKWLFSKGNVHDLDLSFSET